MTDQNRPDPTLGMYPQEDVRRFMEASGQEPSPDNMALYLNLVSEEFAELGDAARQLQEAHSDDERITAIDDMIDAIHDLVWVSYGLAHSMGADPLTGWRKVARANLAKIDPATGKVLKRPDGKVLKPEGWTAPSHKDEAARVVKLLTVRG